MNKWFLQREANITAFLEDDDFVTKRNFFFKMCKALDKNAIEWNLFCSCSLFFAGITDEFNDFDILVKKPSFEDTKIILKDLGLSVKQEEICGIQFHEEVSPEDASLFEEESVLHTHLPIIYLKRYANLIGDGIDVDLFTGFHILGLNKIYRYRLNPSLIDTIQVGDLSIKIVAPEVQFILYAMMECWQPQRRSKRKLIEEYLMDTGINKRYVLKHFLRKKDIPLWIKKEIRMLLN